MGLVYSLISDFSLKNNVIFVGKHYVYGLHKKQHIVYVNACAGIINIVGGYFELFFATLAPVSIVAYVLNSM